MVSIKCTGISILFVFCLFSQFCLGFPLLSFSVVGRLLGERQEYDGACPWLGKVDGSFFVENEMCR